MAPQVNDPALKKLILNGREQGFLTYRELNDHLPEATQGTDQVEAVVDMLNDAGIDVFDQAPDAEALLLEGQPPADAVAEEAEAVLPASIDSEFDRTRDPIRAYMRQVGPSCGQIVANLRPPSLLAGAARLSRDQRALWLRGQRQHRAS